MKFTTRIKQFIYPLYIYWRANGRVRRKLHAIYDEYAQQAKAGVATTHKGHPLKLFSSLDEDGIILWLMATLGIKQGHFVDVGSNDCINSNCASLALNFNWSGIFIDADKRLLNIGRRNYRRFGKSHRLQFVQSFVTPETINALLHTHLQGREVDFMSIDIDGNDYEIFEAISTRPKVFVVENKVEYGSYDIAITERNGAGFQAEDYGASPYTMTRLAEAKGYTLVAANVQGFNTFYLRNDLVKLPFIKLELEALLSESEVKKDLYGAERMEGLVKRQAKPIA